MRFPEGYYVYAYLRDTDDDVAKAGSPYYIGKGRGQRAWVGKRRDAPRPTNPLLVRIIADDMTCVDARQAEIFLIKYFGRIDEKTGILVNRTRGGEGRGQLPHSATYRITVRVSDQVYAALIAELLEWQKLRGPRFSLNNLCEEKLSTPFPPTQWVASTGTTGTNSYIYTVSCAPSWSAPPTPNQQIREKPNGKRRRTGK